MARPFLVPFRRLLRLAGSRWRYSTPPPHGLKITVTTPHKIKTSLLTSSDFCVWYLILTSCYHLSRVVSSLMLTTDGQSTSVSWNKAPIWGLGPDFYYCQTVAGMFMWDALSDERTNLLFTISAGPRQRSGLTTIFYCLTFATSLFVSSWDSQGYGGGIRPRLHAGLVISIFFKLCPLHVILLCITLHVWSRWA
jgi:hypothetical protein